MNVLDVGCGMGFFSLPIARMVGETGRVVYVDLQTRMINGLLRRSKNPPRREGRGLAELFVGALKRNLQG